MSKKQKKIYNVLSLDGGGVRGLIPLRFLQALEEATGQPSHKIFDTIVGTSTGGFITALLSLPKQGRNDPVPAKEALEIYKGFGPNIFPTKAFGPKQFAIGLLSFLIGALFIFFQMKTLRDLLPEDQRTYSRLVQTSDWAAALATLLLTCLFIALIFAGVLINTFLAPKYTGKSVVDFCNSHFPPQVRLKDAATNVGICATDLEKRRPFVFNSMRSKLNPNCLLHSVSIAKIARATSAAPTYFKPEFFLIVYPEKSNPTMRIKKEDLVEEITPWDSRDKETLYDRQWIAFEDGGTKMNNPSKAALKLAQLHIKQKGENPDDYEIRLLSLGTGSLSGKQDDPTKTFHNCVLHCLEWLGKKRLFKNFLDKLVHNQWTGSALGVIDRRLTGDVFEVLINAHNDHLEVKQFFKERGNPEGYRRQQFKITEHQLDNMDDCSESNMDGLVKQAENMLFEGGDNDQEQKKKEWSKTFKECVNFLSLKIVQQPPEEKLKKE